MLAILGQKPVEKHVDLYQTFEKKNKRFLKGKVENDKHETLQLEFQHLYMEEQ
jgi:hypothetical protein